MADALDCGCAADAGRKSAAVLITVTRMLSINRNIIQFFRLVISGTLLLQSPVVWTKDRLVIQKFIQNIARSENF